MTVGNTQRSPLFSRFQGGDLVIADINRIPAAVWFVGSTVTLARDSANYGRTPEGPFATLKYALTQVGADDTVYLLPGHVETVSGGDTSIATAGLRVIGLARNVGGNEPKVTFGDATSALAITAGGVVLENIIFDGASFAAVAACLKISSAAAIVQNCQFLLATVLRQAVLGILTNASASRSRILNCYFYGTADAGVTAAVRIVGGDSLHIEDCDFIGAYSAAVGAIQVTGTNSTNLFILGCAISNETANSTTAISATGGTTGMIAGCALQILSGTAPITGTGISWAGGNFYAAAVGTGATLV